MLHELERPDLLMMGMLLHDIGKGRGHGHVAKGIPLVRELTERVGLPPADADTVTFLVAHHVTMSHVAQRRDLDDPKTVESLAALCETPERLRMLYCLTVADMRAVGPGVMTGWHAQILSELFRRTLLYLTGGRPTPPGREQIIGRVRAALGPEGSAGGAAGHLAMLSDRYLAATAPERMAAHLRLVDQLDEEPVATELFHHPDLGSSDLVIVTRDQPGLFSLIAGGLASQGVNILSAQIFTRGDGVAIDTFQVNDPFGEAVTEEARWRRVLDVLRRVLRREQTVEALLAARRTGRPLGEGFAGPVKIAVDNHISDTHTVIEVKCPDRVGLLYMITRTLSALGCDIATARIATEVEQAFDTFYVTDRQGRRIEDPAAIDQIRDALEEALLKPL